MKVFFAGAALLALALGPVMAADMGQPPAPAPVYTKAPMMPVYSWTGGYIGVNAGYAWGDSEVSTTTLSPPASYFAVSSVPAIATAGAQAVKPNGFTGGAQIGYNWQASSSTVLGVEVDFQSFRLLSTVASAAAYPCCAGTGFAIAQGVQTDWLATFRARLGYLVTPSTLLYVTGGGAVTNFQGAFAFVDTFGPAVELGSFNTTKLGWTVGGGVEWAMWSGWSAKAEYLFVSFPTVTTTSTNLVVGGVAVPTQTFTHSADLDANIVRLGLNYKFGGPVVAKY
jgi:outer membrane immunogenic protein